MKKNSYSPKTFVYRVAVLRVEKISGEGLTGRREESLGGREVKPRGDRGASANSRASVPIKRNPRASDPGSLEQARLGTHGLD